MERIGIQLERPNSNREAWANLRWLSAAGTTRSRGGRKAAAVNCPGESLKHYLETRIGHEGHVAQIEARGDGSDRAGAEPEGLFLS